MQRLIPVIILGLLTLVARGDDKLTPAAAALADLNKSYTEAHSKYRLELGEKRSALDKALAEAKTDEEKKEIKKKLNATYMPNDSPGPAFAVKFLKLAQDNPQDPAAFDSLNKALQICGGSMVKHGVWHEVLEEIRKNHLTHPKMRSVLNNMASGPYTPAQMFSNGADEASERFLREIAARHPDKQTQGLAFDTLLWYMNGNIRVAEQIQKDVRMRDYVEQILGKDFADKEIADADKHRQKAEEVKKILRERYADVVPVIGAPALEMTCKDLNGDDARLSALKGKVVVVDIWTTWCGPCRRMIPHEREMVEKFKDKPFVLVSISADDDKKTLTDFLEKEKMPWTHWWNGPKGGIMEQWNVTASRRSTSSMPRASSATYTFGTRNWKRPSRGC